MPNLLAGPDTEKYEPQQEYVPQIFFTEARSPTPYFMADFGHQMEGPSYPSNLYQNSQPSVPKAFYMNTLVSPNYQNIIPRPQPYLPSGKIYYPTTPGSLIPYVAPPPTNYNEPKYDDMENDYGSGDDYESEY